MPEPDAMVRHPLSDHGQRLLHFLVTRRRGGEVTAPTLQTANDELGWVLPSTRGAAAELHERRIAVAADPSTLAPIRWPLLMEVSSKRFWMSLGDQLSAAGAAPREGMAAQWAEAEETQSVPPPERTGDAPADEAWYMLRAAHHARFGEALAAARRAAAGTIGTGLVPMLARAAGWLGRAMAALDDPAAPALRHEPPMSAYPAAAQVFAAAWQAEVLRSRAQAAALYAEAVRADPAFLRARLRQACVLFHDGDTDGALAAVGPAIAADPRPSAPRLVRAEVLIAAAAHGDAPPDWEETAKADILATRDDPGGDRSLASLLASRLLVLKADLPRAIAAARQAVALEPGRHENYHALGLALTQDGQWVAAAEAEMAALLADHGFMAAGEALFALRSSPGIEAAIPPTKSLLEETWQ